MTGPGTASGYRAGSRPYRHATLALFAAGMATFMTLWCVQGLLPVFSAAFAVTPSRAALAVSVTTALLALAIVPVSMLSERFGRVPVMTFSALSSTAVGLLLPWSPTFEVLVAGRALQGLLCAGVPAVAMTYLVEELDARDFGAAMGIYVAGTSVGGLTGRLIPAIGVDVIAWEWAFQVGTALAALFAVVFVWRVPASRNFTPRRIPVRQSAREHLGHLRDRTLFCLFGLGFLLLGAFMALYNFLAYRLLNPPFSLPESVVGSVFFLYLVGTVSAATAGRLGTRTDRGHVLLGAIAVMGVGVALTLSHVLIVLLVGVTLTTAGFFAAHSIASGWVPSHAKINRSGASSLYLLAYYLGSAVLGGLAGPVFTRFGWPGLVGYLTAILTISALTALVLLRTGSNNHSPKIADRPDTPESTDTEPPVFAAQLPEPHPPNQGFIPRNEKIGPREGS